MKPAPFSYVRPKTVDEACEALASDSDSRVIAGGQTLVPMLAMRLARPTLLVDVTRISDLHGIRETDQGIEIGAVTRQFEALASSLIGRKVPLLAKALPHVGHPPTRARGTVGGSIAHGDPSAEIALAATILGATICYRDADEEVDLLPEDFFLGPTLTSAPMGGCLTRVVFPKRPDGRVGAGFQEIASRRSDYAFASAGAQVELDDDGICVGALLGVGSIGDVPTAIDISSLCGSRLDDEDIQDVVAAALSDIEAVDDLHATASYRRRAASRLAFLALVEARDAALAEGVAA